MTKTPVPGDEANHHYVCTYDAWNRLVKVTDDSPARLLNGATVAPGCPLCHLHN